MSELLGGRTLDQFCSLRQQETARFLIFQKKTEVGEAVDIGGELLIHTNRIITRMTMSKTCCENDGDVEDIGKLVQRLFRIAGKFDLLEYKCRKNLYMQGITKRL
ncbi:putative 3,9-dihydroxypterocarpan 6A-monooxygenase [Medicago truncatula]|uniref:Putative 3,9-dihydroxypterocarpan 6A-monooxygenase n=1 Tax=Medicago truncatula TaxID=3880 RepID=A0A396GPK2_MEDTR|nr:putative 3,9-dihydroxypterocarpan 6A-monooxygenase [Medicago truncatula]